MSAGDYADALAKWREDGRHLVGPCPVCQEEVGTLGNRLIVHCGHKVEVERLVAQFAAQIAGKANGARPGAKSATAESKRAPQADRAEIPPIPPVYSSVEEIKRTIKVLHPDPRDIFEIRVLGTDGKVVGAGFYDRDHIDKAAKTAAAQDAKACSSS